MSARAHQPSELTSSSQTLTDSRCTHLTLYEQNWALITDQMTSSDCMIATRNGEDEGGEVKDETSWRGRPGGEAFGRRWT